MNRAFIFGNHLPIILSSEFDDRECNTFADKLILCCESILGGRNSITYSHEIRLVSSLLFFSLTISQGDFVTPGQEFCGLGLVEPFIAETLISNEETENRNNANLSQNLLVTISKFFQRSALNSYQRIRHRKSLVAAVMLSAIPYLRARRMYIFRTALHLWAVLTSDDDSDAERSVDSSSVNSASISHERRPSMRSTSSSNPNNAASSTLGRHIRQPIAHIDSDNGTSNGIRNSGTVTGGIDTDINNNNNNNSNNSNNNNNNSSYKAFLGRLQHTIVRTWEASGSGGATSADRVQSLLAWMQDLHLLMFFISGRFYNLSYRLCGVRIMQQSGSKRRAASMRASVLAWLVGIRLALLTAHTAGRLIANYADAVSGSDSNSTADTSNNNGNSDTGIVNHGGGGGSAGTSDSERREQEGQLMGTMARYHRSTDLNDDEQPDDAAQGSYTIDHNSDKQSKSQSQPSSNHHTSTVTSSSSSRQCPLCMDAVQRPAATPCGHVYCWKCIVRWSFSQDTAVGRDHRDSYNAASRRRRNTRNHNGTVSSGAGAGVAAGGPVRCPVCRHPFHTQSIRCLFGYS